jgi:hypothetical protein
MSPEDVKPEWVEKAVNIFADEYLPGEDAPHAMRAALAAVLPLALAEVERERDEAGAEAWEKGYAASDYEAYHLGTHGRMDNPYRESTARCNCGYGGYHEPENPDCDINKEEA